MTAKETSLLKFLQKTQQFVIPIYQRPYSWERRHCIQLWRDLVRVGQDRNGVAHFLGSIVYLKSGEFSVSTVDELLVVDGQQRLTTISLLLLAIGRIIGTESDKIDINRKKLENYYLFNADEDGELRYKLLLTRRDKETLIRLLDNKELLAGTPSHLIENYEFFETQLKGENLEVIYSGLQKLRIVDISLSRDSDDPQLIFESLNSTGLDLSQADLIRNYVLMRQDPASQQQLYEDFWLPMEESFGRAYTKRFDLFIRDYLTLKTRHIPKIDRVYESFKAYVQESPDSIKGIVEKIYHYSKFYVRIALLKEDDSELLSHLNDINILRVEVSFPFLLEVYEDDAQGRLEKSEVIEILRLIESYVFRRAICGIPTNALNKIFAGLMVDVDKDNYLESLKIALCQRRFPSNQEFQQAFPNKDVYNFRSRNYLLRKLENSGHNKEPINDVENYTIEHVMPQNRNLSQAWQRELGEDWKEIQDKYLHTIGNLTLTGYNSELSDHSFKEKQRDVFRKSPLYLNQSLAEIEQWNETAIVQRAKNLSETALQIWINADVPQEILDRIKALKLRQTYTLSDYPYLINEMAELFQQLRLRICNLDASVNEQMNKHYITYKVDTTFANVQPQANCLRLILNLPFPDIIDPQGWCRDVTDVGKLGSGDVEVKLSSKNGLDYIMFLVKQAFEKQMEDEV